MSLTASVIYRLTQNDLQNKNKAIASSETRGQKAGTQWPERLYETGFQELFRSHYFIGRSIHFHESMQLPRQ